MTWTVYRDPTGVPLWINGDDGNPLPWTEANARLIVKAPEMAELLGLICEAEASAPNEDAFHGMIYDKIAEARQLLAEIEGKE